MLGRPRESARLAQAGLELMRHFGIDSTLLVSNEIEALIAIGEWDEAERLSAVALRRIASSFPYVVLMVRAGLESGRGEFDAARTHLEAASRMLPEERLHGLYDATSQTSPSGSVAGRTPTRPSTRVLLSQGGRRRGRSSELCAWACARRRS